MTREATHRLRQWEGVFPHDDDTDIEDTVDDHN